MTFNRTKQRVIPEDLRDWFSEQNLVKLALNAAAEVSWPDARKRTTCLSQTPEPVLRTLLLYAYARGVFFSDTLESLCKRDDTCGYICAGAYPLSGEIRNFRRLNISWLQTSLAILLKRAIAQNLHDVPVSSANISELAREEAALRLRRAVQADSMALDN